MHRPFHLFLMWNVGYCLKFVRFDPVGIGRVVISYLGSFLCRLFLVLLLFTATGSVVEVFWIVLSRRSIRLRYGGSFIFLDVLVCLSIVFPLYGYYFITSLMTIYISLGSPLTETKPKIILNYHTEKRKRKNKKSK